MYGRDEAKIVSEADINTVGEIDDLGCGERETCYSD